VANSVLPDVPTRMFALRKESVANVGHTPKKHNKIKFSLTLIEK
jgi:hypothetical protein